jgi:hypothetical protein
MLSSAKSAQVWETLKIQPRGLLADAEAMAFFFAAMRARRHADYVFASWAAEQSWTSEDHRGICP